MDGETEAEGIEKCENTFKLQVFDVRLPAAQLCIRMSPPGRSEGRRHDGRRRVSAGRISWTSALLTGTTSNLKCFPTLKTRAFVLRVPTQSPDPESRPRVHTRVPTQSPDPESRHRV